MEEIGEEESPYLTLEEAEQLALEKKEKAHCKKWARESKDQVHKLFKMKYKFKIYVLILIHFVLEQFNRVSSKLRRYLQVRKYFSCI